ncbi:hypothetical protein Oweho_3417 [Owenweeksia hongkongensis DSM 17368]|uniref:Abortive infection protein-like C-terminal domain-containing protein n=1 Tax=Owenweeksia hongkongensis (strain DSM 17368 / CIP 108786 / JCM 12287 / NRRL B-23963 / UST20020801) TaxID=926562 RepID=G8R5Q0_OWEHD|nr:abortive infection family protein [Owenweeksia hongkongensis]AEV34366.1 hypothetical protein Oweho_3417 [Owenweeksia hongkongensis DSM 17368]
MKVSEKTITFLAEAISGDMPLLSYKKGYEIVNFFNQFGSTDEYPFSKTYSRKTYTESKLREYNGQTSFAQILEVALDPREFIASFTSLEEVLESFNLYLEYDGYKIIKRGKFCKVVSLTEGLVKSESTKALDVQFVQEQIEKCKQKIDSEDFSGAITNARSLAEAVMIEIVADAEGVEVKNDGKLDNLYRRAKKALKLNHDRSTLPDEAIQIISGLDSITSGLAGLSNNIGDRHANKYRTRKHHARLAVNATLTLVDFLLDVKEFQNNQAPKTNQP